MAQGKQAKILTPKQESAVLHHLNSTRYPQRDRVMFFLSVKAGMRAKEISGLTWSMITDAEGNVADTIALENKVSKGKGGGRSIPMHPSLRSALVELQQMRGERIRPEHPIIHSERELGLSAASVTKWFFGLYKSLGMDGCSSHSGRRTFITRAARKVSEAGGSIRDVQQLAGHSSLQVTQSYIEANSEAKRKLVSLI
jgi:integrase/recombinase XerC